MWCFSASSKSLSRSFQCLPETDWRMPSLSTFRVDVPAQFIHMREAFTPLSCSFAKCSSQKVSLNAPPKSFHLSQGVLTPFMKRVLPSTVKRFPSTLMTVLS